MSIVSSPSDGSTVIDGLAAGLPGASLERVETAAALMTRIDRKYVVAPEGFAATIERCGRDLSVLEIEQRRSFRYETVYFDTAHFDAYLDAARDRRRRFKIRTRTYVDSGTCRLEVKQTGGRGETVKVSIPYDPADRRRLTADGTAFIAEHLSVLPRLPLRPVLTTTYRRTTLVDLDQGARVTCDADLGMTDNSGRSARLNGRLLIETKSMSAGTPLDRELWSAHCRPAVLSKFAVGMALLHPRLPANKWHRAITTYFERNG